MPLPKLNHLSAPVFGAVLSALLAIPAVGADTNLVLAARSSHVKEPAKPASGSALAIAQTPAPASTFTIPREVKEGRDPFFPNSVRVYSTARTTKTAPVAAFDGELVLRGFSGSSEQPSAIINTTTFMRGDTSEVIHSTGRVKVQCIDIDMNAGSVLIQIGTERRELRLKRD